jgi:hypothetical protein
LGRSEGGGGGRMGRRRRVCQVEINPNYFR